MELDHSTPYDWFTAGEVADLARRECIAGIPHTKSGMIKYLKRRTAGDPDEFGRHAVRLSRVRRGQKGGGGLEYHWTLFGSAGRSITAALRQEAQARQPDASTLAPVSFDLSLDDHKLMGAAVGAPFGWQPVVGPLKRRIVRRGHVIQNNERFYVGRQFNGQFVLVGSTRHPVEYTEIVAFIWAFHPVHGRGEFVAAAIAERKQGFFA